MRKGTFSVFMIIIAIVFVLVLQSGQLFAQKEQKDYLTIGSNLINKEFARPGLLKSFGAPEVKSKIKVSPVDGFKHQEWNYKSKGIYLDILFNDKNKQEISSITITKKGIFKTLKDISLGSSKEDVLKAYKNEVNPEETNSNTIVAGTIYGGIIFEIINNKVSKIFLGASAE